MKLKPLVKSVSATIEPVADAQAEDPNGEFVLILADPTEDREGDELKREEWKTPLPEHISIDTDHGMSVKSTIGSGKPELLPDGRIKVPGTYASTAHGQDTRALVNEGHIRGASVTYLQRITKSAGKTVVQRELLNGTLTPIPANPRALIVSSKAVAEAVETETPEQEAAEDATVQAIHDLTIALGADCTVDNAEPDAKNLTYRRDTPPTPASITIVTKGIKGSVEDLQQRVSCAIRKDAADREYPWVRATFLDEPTKGTVVYELDGPAGRAGTFARGFTDDGAEVTLDAEVRSVSLVTSVVEDQGDNAATAAATASKSVATDAQFERAVELISKAAGGMTREAALNLLGRNNNGVIVASSEGAAAGAPAEAAATEKSVAAAEAAATDAAASPAELRARALILSMDAAAG